MSAKMAEQQMKEIQSESQRMARQIPVTYVFLKRHDGFSGIFIRFIV